MAANTIVRFTAHLKDDEGKKGTIIAHLYVDSAQTIANAVTAINAWLAAIAPCIDASIVGSTIAVLSGDLSATYPVTAGADLEETGNLDFSVATVPYHYGFTLLSLKDSVLVGDQLDTGATPLSTLITLMEGAVLGGNYTDMGARAISTLAYSFQGDRKHRRKLHQISLKVE
jgi:hypothetical protein